MQAWSRNPERRIRFSLFVPEEIKTGGGLVSPQPGFSALSSASSSFSRIKATAMSSNDMSPKSVPSRKRTAAVPANGWISMNGVQLMHDMQFGYRFSPRLTLFVNGRNVFNYQRRNYWGPVRGDILYRNYNYGAIWTVGVRGGF